MQDGSLSKETEPPGAFENSAAIAMAIVCGFSLLAATGWILNQPILASLSPEYIPMAPATAYLFLGLCGVWLIHRFYRARAGMMNLIKASLVGMFAIVIILAIRYFSGLGPDLEKILYPSPPLFGQFSSARMSPLSALGFFLAIPALFLLITGRPGTHTTSVSAALSLALLIFSGLICLGFLYGAPLFYGGPLIPMALSSAISFLFLSLGLLVTAGPTCWPVRMYAGPSIKARLMRAFIPASVSIVLLQGLLSTMKVTWIINPAVRGAFAAFLAFFTVFLIISLIANNLGSEIERGRMAEKALIRSEAELRALFAGMADVVIVYDTDGRYIEIAPTNPANLIQSPEEMLGKTLHEILPKKAADTILSMIRLSIRNDKVVNGEYTLQIRGKETYFSASASRLSETTALMVAHDITMRKRMEQEIRNLSLTDELTGLYNRRGFTVLAEHEMNLAHREKRSMLLVFGDIDDLKKINDTLGHAEGDMALKEISTLLKNSFREADILARYGGDEFVVLAVDSSMESSDALTKRILGALEADNQMPDRSYQLSLSIGVACYEPKTPCMMSELIAQADAQMYAHKQARKARQ